MARPWRLRQKLVLGLAVVVASIVLLLGGTLLALSSYVEAGRVTRHKLQLIEVVNILREHVYRIAGSGPHTETRPGETAHMLHEIDEARRVVGVYRLMHGDADWVTPVDNHEDERFYLTKIEDRLNAMERAIRAPAATAKATGNRRVIDDPAVRVEYDKLLNETTQLLQYLKGHIEGAIQHATANHRRGLFIIGSATAVALVLVLTLLYYFRVWVFGPIRQLHLGVQRVHRGDFDHPIRLASQDELEELANEFNAMTLRLKDNYKDLTQQVNERSRQLVRSERLVSVGFLAAGVAHEINNPLASIAFCAEAMERRLLDLMRHDPDNADAVIKYLKVVQQEAFRCKQITQKLLDFSRSEKKREPTDLGRLVQDVIDVTRVLPAAQQKTIQFAPAYLVAPVSPPDLKSVVLNLIVNALESMDAGGVLAIGIRSDGGFAEIAFRDTGCGMTAEVQENIFEPFFTRRRTGNGTGLGLSISHQIIDQHGGTVLAQSDGPGQGSTFVVRVPLAAPEADVLPFPAATKRAA